MVRPLPQPITKRVTTRVFGAIAALSGFGFLGYRLFVSTPRYNGPEVNMSGKVVLVTEPTAKLSRELLQGLARRGAHLILACENSDSCSSTRDKLLRATKVNANLVECRRLELDSMRSIRRFAANLLSDYPRLDRVILQSHSCVTNIIAGSHRLTYDGFDYELGSNYFSLYLLGRLLWNKLESNEFGDGRMILVLDTDAANMAFQGAERISSHLTEPVQVTLPVNDFNMDDPKAYDPKKAYQRSQWFLTLFADELARRSKKSSIMIVNPRITRGTAPSPKPVSSNGSDATQNWSWSNWFGAFIDFGSRLLRRKAAATTLFCAVTDECHTQPNNQSLSDGACIYQDFRRIYPPSLTPGGTVQSSLARKHLWKISDRWTQLNTHPHPLPLPQRPNTHQVSSNVSSDEVDIQ